MKKFESPMLDYVFGLSDRYRIKLVLTNSNLQITVICPKPKIKMVRHVSRQEMMFSRFSVDTVIRLEIKKMIQDMRVIEATYDDRR